MSAHTSMHTYNPRMDWIPPCTRSGMSRRDRFYVTVRRTYEFGHYDFAQALFHLLEIGTDTHCVSLWWEKAVKDNPHITTQASTGNSVYAMRG